MRKFYALGRGESTFGSTAPGRATDFLLYIEETISALGRGDFTFGSTAPGRGESTIPWIYRARARILTYIGIENSLRSGAENGQIYSARARRIHIRIYRARARKRFSFLYRDRKFSALGRGESTFGSTAPGFSALGLGESTFGSTAPERGNDFLFYTRDRKFSALGRGESTFGSTAPQIFCARAQRIHLWIYRAQIFCARARRIHIRIYRARARKRFVLKR